MALTNIETTIYLGRVGHASEITGLTTPTGGTSFADMLDLKVEIAENIEVADFYHGLGADRKIHFPVRLETQIRLTPIGTGSADALRWLRDRLGMTSSALEWDAISRGIQVYLKPITGAEDYGFYAPNCVISDTIGTVYSRQDTAYTGGIILVPQRALGSTKPAYSFGTVSALNTLYFT